MKDRGTYKFTAIYCIIVGAVNIVLWVFLIVSGRVSDFSERPISYVFHWLSEFSTASLLIWAGIRLLQEKGNLNLLFLSLGFLLLAIGGAFIHYMVNFELALFIISTLITGSTIILLILIYENLNNFLFFTNGVALYGLLNGIGQSLQAANISMLTMTLPAFLFIFIITVNLINKDVVFRYVPYLFKSNDKKMDDTSQEDNQGQDPGR